MHLGPSVRVAGRDSFGFVDEVTAATGLDAALSTFTSADYTPPADGTTPTTLTFTARDADNVLVADEVVTFTVLPRYTVSAALSAVVAAAETPTDTPTAVSITLLQANGQPAVGIDASAVVLSASGADNTIVQPSGRSNELGVISGATYTATTAGARTLTVTVGGLALDDQPVVTVGSAPSFAANLPAWAVGSLVTDTTFGNMLAGEALNADGLGTTTNALNPLASVNGTDEAAPYGSDTYRILYPGDDAGNGQGQTLLFGSDTEAWRRLYLCIAVYLPADYVMHTNEEKFFYPLLDVDDVFSSLCIFGWYTRDIAFGSGGGATASTWAFGYDAQIGDGRQYPAMAVYPEKGRYNIIEMELVMNTAGASDGVYRTWVDGTLCQEKIDARFNAAGSGVITLQGIRFASTRGAGVSSVLTPPGGQDRRYNRLAVYATTTGP